MPGTGLILQIICTGLQYAFLFFLYYFLYRIVRLMYQDLTAASGERQPEASPAPARLTVIDAGGIELARPFFDFRTHLSIGRGDENDVVIIDTYVSHQHVLIQSVENQYSIEDLNSINHTYVNQEMLKQKAYLKSGDLIQVGLVTFKFER